MTIDYSAYLRDDLAEQFKGQPKIEAICNAIGQQMSEVYDFFEQLSTCLNIDSAEGALLDRIGEIVVLSRKEAQELLGKSDAVTDEEYRQMIKYKIRLNYGDATRKSIINAVKTINGGMIGFRVENEAERPATIILKTDRSPSSEGVLAMYRTPVPKAGGVQLVVQSQEVAEININVGILSYRSFRINYEVGPLSTT